MADRAVEASSNGGRGALQIALFHRTNPIAAPSRSLSRPERRHVRRRAPKKHNSDFFQQTNMAVPCVQKERQKFLSVYA